MIYSGCFERICLYEDLNHHVSFDNINVSSMLRDCIMIFDGFIHFWRWSVEAKHDLIIDSYDRQYSKLMFFIVRLRFCFIYIYLNSSEFLVYDEIQDEDLKHH
jgi:hypothetical protein